MSNGCGASRKNDNIYYKKRKQRMIKRITSNKNIVLAAFFLAFSTVLVSAEKGPRIKFDKDSWDFGKVKEGQKRTCVFRFQNTGDEALLIRRTRTTCGCTVALVSEKTLGPGQKGELKVTFDSRGYKGNVAKYIYVESNDRDKPVVQLLISAFVEVPPGPEIEIDRQIMDVGLVLEGEEVLASAVIKNLGERELKVNFSHGDASFYSGGKKLTSALRIPSGKEALVEVKIPPRDKTGMNNEYIVVKSNDRQRPNHALYIRSYVVTKKQLKQLFDKYGKVIK